MCATKLSLKCRSAPKKNPFFNDSEAKIKCACEPAEKAEVSVFTFRRAVIWKVGEHAQNRIPESRVVAPVPAPPTAQQASSKLAAPPPVTDATRRCFGFRIIVSFSSVCIWLRLSGLCFSAALKLFSIGGISFSPSAFGFVVEGSAMTGMPITWAQRALA